LGDYNVEYRWERKRLVEGNEKSLKSVKAMQIVYPDIGLTSSNTVPGPYGILNHMNAHYHAVLWKHLAAAGFRSECRKLMFWSD
jgi:hypothetical protein